jgi:hypothetical protein
VTEFRGAYKYVGGCEKSCSEFSFVGTSSFCCRSNLCNRSTKQSVPITMIALSFTVFVIFKLFQTQAV